MTKKVYAIDPAFAHRLGFNFSENKGRILENIVYLELLRRGKEVYYHSGKKECDFVVKEGLDIVEAIQVAYQVNINNHKREYQGLQEAMHRYNLKEGLVLNYKIEQSFVPVNAGIKVMPVWEWLLSPSQLEYYTLTKPRIRETIGKLQSIVTSPTT